jgi:S1-C subfamily serine protease
VNLVDLIIVGLLLAAVVHGVTQGAALQVLSFGGFWAGLALGALIGPRIADRFEGGFGGAFVLLFTVFGLALMGSALGRYVGTHAWSALRRLRLGGFDAALGAVVAAGATLVAVWLVALLLSAGPTRDIANAMHDSAIVRTLIERLPPAPSVFSRLQRFVDSSPFPRVFEGLEPTPSEPVALPDDPTVRAAVAAARTSTVKVVGFGCGGIQSGSGFVVAPGLVVTNAHVVAGIRDPVVNDGSDHRATTVLFDPDKDIAVLRTTGLRGRPLALLPATVERGTGGAVLGYPGGGGFTAAKAAVLRQFTATGRDIYGQSLTRRAVYQLQASVRQGNSGGPFVRSDGTVMGLIFAASTTDQGVGYALTSPEVRPRVEQARGQTSEVSTRDCAA